MVRALELRLEIADSIPAAALSSASLIKLFPLSPSSIIWYQCKLGSKQTHRVTHWPGVHGLASSPGVWLRATESEISAALKLSAQRNETETKRFQNSF